MLHVGFVRKGRTSFFRVYQWQKGDHLTSNVYSEELLAATARKHFRPLLEEDFEDVAVFVESSCCPFVGTGPN